MSEHPSDTLVGIEGEVKWFNTRIGFGFIVGPDEQDVMVHYSVIQGSGYRLLRDGARVEYDATLTDKGWKATRVVRIGSVETPKHRSAARAPRR